MTVSSKHRVIKRYYTLHKVGKDGKRSQMMGCGSLEDGEKIIASIYKVKEILFDEHEEEIEEIFEVKEE